MCFYGLLICVGFLSLLLFTVYGLFCKITTSLLDLYMGHTDETMTPAGQRLEMQIVFWEPPRNYFSFSIGLNLEKRAIWLVILFSVGQSTILFTTTHVGHGSSQFEVTQLACQAANAMDNTLRREQISIYHKYHSSEKMKYTHM